MEASRTTLAGVLKVEIAAAPYYFVGLPIIISVTCSNDTTDATLFRVPDLDLTFEQGSRINVSLVPKDGAGVPLDSGFARGEEEERGLAFPPGTKRRMVCDLTNMGVVFHPGQYTLSMTLALGPDVYQSNTVPVELLALSEGDRREAQRLRLRGTDSRFDTGAWRSFLTDNADHVSVAPTLAAAARPQLALHVFLQRAIWTPGKLGQIDMTPLRAIHGPHVDAEVAAITYELLHARHDAHAATFRTAMLERFPGLRHRADAVDHGKGELATYRLAFGIEADFMGHPTPHPYGK